eukprot:s1364_g5.t1
MNETCRIHILSRDHGPKFSGVMGEPRAVQERLSNAGWDEVALAGVFSWDRILEILAPALAGLQPRAQIPLGTAGPQPRAPDLSGQTSTRSARSAGPQPRAPDPSGHCRTSRPDRMSDR